MNMRNHWRIIAGVLLVTACCARAATLAELFATAPIARGWKVFGDTNLFRWNATNENLEVTWDSSRSNSFFHLPLGTIVSKSDDFSLAFDLRLSDIAIGTSSNKPDTFEIAIGLINSINATNPNSFRGMGVSAAYGVRNAIEFDYFPAAGIIDATFAPTVISSNNAIAFSDNRLEMSMNALFRISMTYSASNQTLKTSVTRNGVPFGSPPGNTLKDLALANHKDFRVDQLAIINYSDALQFGSTQYWGSILAHGVVDNVVVNVPDGPLSDLVGTKTNSTWRATFATKTNWFYSLERTEDFVAWSPASPTNSGTGGMLLLEDTNASADQWFYRVKVSKP
ncbi:MAG TPA: hypothetical protein VK846_00580 [Candidatus Limnocylindria bacterium]|nr:hypothetical protein [Candidatus Limnocylindria bacterium]